MELTNLPMFGLMRQRLGWLTQRQTVLTRNIANADTPEYSAQDLKEFDFKEVLRQFRGGRRNSIAVKTTNPKHLSGPASRGGSTGNFKQVAERRPYETAPDGNSVILEEQMVKMNENTINHSTMTRLYRKHMQMFRSVVTGLVNDLVVVIENTDTQGKKTLLDRIWVEVTYN